MGAEILFWLAGCVGKKIVAYSLTA